MPTKLFSAHEWLCPVWDAGHWQLHNELSKEMNVENKFEAQNASASTAATRLEKELEFFAKSLTAYAQISALEDASLTPKNETLRKESLAKEKLRLGVVVTTPAQIEAASALATHFFIPGEFCRQGDVLAAASHSGATLLVERGAFLAPNDMLRALEKLDPKKVMLVDAGTSFGYSDRVLDVRALALLKATGLPFGVNLSALCAPQGQVSSWKGQWQDEANNREAFVDAFVKTAEACGASFYVYRNEDTHVRRKLERSHY